MTLSKSQIERLKQKKEYIFLVGIEAFSRYAFVQWYPVFNKYAPVKDALVLEEIPFEPDAPIAEVEGQQDDLADDDVITGMKATDVIKSLTKWFLKKSKRMDIIGQFRIR